MTLRVVESNDGLRPRTRTAASDTDARQAVATPASSATTATTQSGSGEQGDLDGARGDRAFEDFLAGYAELNLVACGVGETQKIFEPMVAPLVEALVQEARGGGSPSIKMVASLVAHAYADHLYQLGLLRQTDDMVPKGAAQKHRKSIERRMELAARRALSGLELLRRPSATRVSVHVTEANNVNLGTQQMAVGVRGAQQRKTTASAKRFRRIENPTLP